MLTSQQGLNGRKHPHKGKAWFWQWRPELFRMEKRWNIDFIYISLQFGLGTFNGIIESIFQDHYLIEPREKRWFSLLHSEQEGTGSKQY